MTLVVDASVIVALLVDSGDAGTWAEEVVRGQRLVASGLLPFEVANVLRRLEASGEISSDVASLSHRDLTRLRVQLVGYQSVADRCWALRGNLTSYDACYVALAEALDAPLATLDSKLAAAPGPTCEFRLP